MSPSACLPGTTRFMGIQKLILYIFFSVASLWMGFDLFTNSAMSSEPLNRGHGGHLEPSMVTWGDRAIVVNGARYLVSSSPKAGPTFNNRNRHLVTVIEQQPGHAITVESITDIIAEYKEIDDVWQAAFLSGVIFLVDHTTASDVDIKVQNYLKSLGNSWIDTLPVDTISSDIQPGPYIILEGKLYDTFKLVDDMHGTFMTAVRPPTSDTFEALRLKSSTDEFSAVALPSRIKSRSCLNKPFCGFRIAVKDVLFLKGIKTSLQCRAFYDTYGPNTETAKCNQSSMSIIKLRGILVQMDINLRKAVAQGQPQLSLPTTGLTSPLDQIGTWGSVMRPALWCGLFGLRPTTGSVPLEGMRRSIRFMDTPGVYGRDLGKMKSFVNS
ncbi:hypothetical protein CLAIMM_07656 [Cladophialophora immunda]|nr:hypothetical protein CLAIMM_07656 [Cladophialophora immunda]